MIAKPMPVGSLGVDCVTSLNVADCHALSELGVKFVGKYLGHVSVSELGAILDSGMSMLAIGGYARPIGWSNATGTADAATALGAAKALGLPTGVHVFLDLEGGNMPADAATAYAEAWAAVVAGEGFVPALYAGAGCPLDGAQLYALPHKLYWAPCTPSYVPKCGFAVVQLHPGDQQVAGIEVDFDAVQEDYDGRLPIMTASS